MTKRYIPAARTYGPDTAYRVGQALQGAGQAFIGARNFLREEEEYKYEQEERARKDKQRKAIENANKMGGQVLERMYKLLGGREKPTDSAPVISQTEGVLPPPSGRSFVKKHESQRMRPPAEENLLPPAVEPQAMPPEQGAQGVPGAQANLLGGAPQEGQMPEGEKIKAKIISEYLSGGGVSAKAVQEIALGTQLVSSLYMHAGDSAQALKWFKQSVEVLEKFGLNSPTAKRLIAQQDKIDLEGVKHGHKMKEIKLRNTGKAGEKATKNEDRINDAILEQVDKFKDDAVVEEIRKQRNTIEMSRELLANNDTKSLKTTLGGVMTMYARATGEQRVTEQDIARRSPNPSVKSKVLRAWNELIKNQAFPEDPEVIAVVIEVMKDKAEAQLRGKAGNFARARAENIRGIDAKKFERKLLEQSGLLGGSSGGRTVVKQGYNKETNQTQFIYSDGTKEIVSGQR